ncbi:MAG: outer membrane protein assembly factor [Alkalispirochaeta sp.]
MAFLARLTHRDAVLLLLAIALLVLPERSPASAEGRETPHDAGREVQIFGVSDEIARELQEEVAELIGPIEEGEGRAADVADIAYTMEQNLRRRGFPDARVEYRMFRTTGDRDSQPVRTATGWPNVRIVVFNITTGPLTYFGTFSFSGNDHFTDDELHRYVPVGGAPGADAVRDPFEEQRLNRVLRRIENAYLLEGYIDATVGPVVETVRHAEDAQFIEISIPIEEGTRYHVQAIMIDAPELPRSVRSELEPLSILGGVYFPRQAVVGETEIRHTLGLWGYRPEITYTTELDPTGNATIRYTVETGAPRTFRNLVVTGDRDDALRTRRRFVERLLPFEEGDTLDVLKVESFEERLYGLGVFSFIDITEDPREDEEEGAPIPTDLNLTLREGRSRYVEVAAGWGSYELLRGRINYTDNNLFGRALSWSTTGALSFRTGELSTSLTDRTLFGPSVRLSLDSAYEYRDGPSYERTGAAAGLTGYYQLSETWETDLAYRWSYTEARGITAAIADEEDPALTTGRVSGGIVGDSRDSILLPTRGQRGAVHGMLAVPVLGSEIAFWGLEIEGTTHHRITTDTYFSLHGEYRTRILLEDRTTLPIQERLFLGGAGSVRSFVEDRLGPGVSGGDPRGGLTSALGSIEIRRRLFDELFLAAFYDLGTVGDASWRIDQEIGSGIGLGLRYHLPIGPLRLDVAYNPGETFTQEQRWAIHFAVGLSF